MTRALPIGPQHAMDDPFKAVARLHQSRYRAEQLKVGYQDYGNRLQDGDARALLNYYEARGVREAVRERYPNYARQRDADLLYSGHIPFNFFVPMRGRPYWAAQFLKHFLFVEVKEVLDVRIEFAPSPKQRYLDDATSFDAWIHCTNRADEHVGVGIEVKYTEGPYRIGEPEKARVDDPDSVYWKVTRASEEFSDPTHPGLYADKHRQFWRNHLLGLAMVQRGDIDRFYSVTMYPSANTHCAQAVPDYWSLLNRRGRDRVFGITFEEFFAWIGNARLDSYWLEYLIARYQPVPRPLDTQRGWFPPEQ